MIRVLLGRVDFKGRLQRHGVFLRFSIASTLYSLSTMVAGFVVLRWIPPDDLGIWYSVLLIQSYSLIIQGGVLNGLNRELPFQLGIGDKSRAAALASTAQAIVLGGIVILCSGGIITFALVRDPKVALAALAVFVGSSALLYRNYLTVTFRAEQAFATLARIMLFEAGLVVMTLPLVVFYGLDGMVVRYILLTVVGMTLTHVFRPLRVVPRFSWAELVMLAKVGVPIFACGYLIGVANTFPQVILLSQNGVREVGLFAPAMAVISMLGILPAAVSNYVYPQMSFRLGATSDRTSIWPMAWKTALIFTVFSLPWILLGLVAIPPSIMHFFPRYASSIPAVLYSLIGGAFLGAGISVNALFSLKAWRWLTFYTVCFVGASYLVPCLLLRWFVPLKGVALGFSIVQALNLAIAMIAIYFATRSTFSSNDYSVHESGATPK